MYYDKSSGIYLPKYPEAAAWLKEFWATGIPRPTNGERWVPGASLAGGRNSLAPLPAADGVNEIVSSSLPRKFASDTLEKRIQAAEDSSSVSGSVGGVAQEKREMICGQLVGVPAKRTNLLVVPAGTVWKAEK